MPNNRAKKRISGNQSSSYLDALVCFNLYRGWRAVQDFYDSAFPDSLNPQRVYIIGLCKDEPRRVSDLAAMMHIDDAAISNILRRMQADGLVKSSRAPHDGRVRLVSATPQGRKLADETNEKLYRLDSVLEQDVTPEEIAALRSLVAKIARHI